MTLKALLAGLSLMGVILVSGWAQAGHNNGNEHFSQVHQKGSPHTIPELDPTTAGAALLLVLGGVAIAHGRRRSAA
ncbi:MAG: hypothetical protein JWM82_104 [Myxococcales bacterium]|nr:hypothetical protein [Myxococcales bacterium]